MGAKQIEQGIKINSPVDILEEAIQNAGGLCLNHFDGLQRELELSIIGVVLAGSNSNILNSLRDEGRSIGDIVEEFRVVCFELLSELRDRKQLMEFWLALEE